MSAAIVVAIIAAGPPTLASLLAYVTARSSQRAANRDQAAAVAHSLDTLEDAVTRIESTLGRVEDGVIELRERVARLEGARTACGCDGA